MKLIEFGYVKGIKQGEPEEKQEDIEKEVISGREERASLGIRDKCLEGTRHADF